MAVYTVNRRRAIILLILSSVLLLTLDLRGNPLIDRMRSAFSTVLTPFETAGRVVANPIRNIWHGATDYQALEKENERLRAQVAAQRGNDLAAKAAYNDYLQLLALNGLTVRYPTVTARVVGGAPGNFEQTVEVDRGGDDGIAVGMAVVDASGLVGKITKVYDDRSVVLLVTDASYAIECKVAGFGEAADDAFGTGDPAADPDDPAADRDEDGAGEQTSTTTAETTPSGERVSDLTSTTTTVPPTTTSSTLVPPAGGSATANEPTTTIDPAQSTTTVAPTTTTEPQPVVRETGECAGRGIDKLPVMRYVTENPASGSLEVGDVITTTGGSTSLAPPDIVIGEVANKVRRAGSAGPLLEIDLAVDLAHLNYVQIVRYVPPSEVPSG